MNPLLAPVDITTYGTPSEGVTGTGKGFLGSDGFLSKAAETANDLFGLWGGFEIQKAKIERIGDKDPVIEESQRRAGILPSLTEQSRVPLYVIGGVAAVGAIVAIVIASRN